MRLIVMAALLVFLAAPILSGCAERSELLSRLGIQTDGGFRNMVAAAIEDGRRRYEEGRPPAP